RVRARAARRTRPRAWAACRSAPPPRSPAADLLRRDASPAPAPGVPCRSSASARGGPGERGSDARADYIRQIEPVRRRRGGVSPRVAEVGVTAGLASRLEMAPDVGLRAIEVREPVGVRELS